MPNRAQHLKASKILLGYSNPLVHDILDRSVSGPDHRRTHEPKTVNLIGDLFGADAKTEAWLHIFLDYGLAKLPFEKRKRRSKKVCDINENRNKKVGDINENRNKKVGDINENRNKKVGDINENRNKCMYPNVVYTKGNKR